MPPQYRPEPPTLNVDRLVSSQIHFLSDPVNERPPSLALSFAPELKAPAVLLGRANVREPKKIERLGLSETSHCPPFGRETAELDQSSLLRMQYQPKLRESFLQIFQKLDRL